MRRPIVLVALATLVAGLWPGPAGAQIPPTPPRDRWYAANDQGHWSDGTRVRIDESCLSLPEGDQLACSLEAFRRQPFTVIAFVDSGINPYHQDFRAPEFAHHPSAYIEGYPANAESVDLSFDLADTEGYDAARNADDATEWSGLRTRRLYWIPGTRIIGGYTTSGCASNCGSNPNHEERAIIDDGGHGSGVASVAAGRFFGSNPNALIVMVEGLGEANLTWATSQPWIDIVSNSWGNIANLPLGSVTSTRNATRRGQTVAFAAGNGTTNTNSSTVFPPGGQVEDPCKCKIPDSNPSFTSPYGGPSWVLTVGAASPINGQAHWWHSVPVDVSSFGSKWRAADAFGVLREQNRDFGGTSCATPTTSGVLSAVIQRAREVLGDTVSGQRPGQVVAQAAEGAVLPAAGPLADGALTRVEAETVTIKTAFPVPAEAEKITWDYAVRPTTGTPYDYAIQGYGIVDRASKARALRVLLAEDPMPDRSTADQVIAGFDAIRNAIWGNP
jgi:hypothetical protein